MTRAELKVLYSILISPLISMSGVNDLKKHTLNPISTHRPHLGIIDFLLHHEQ